MNISQQAYGKRERGGADGFSPDDLARFAQETKIDARWLLGQIGGPIEEADLRHNPENMISASELFKREARRLEEAKKNTTDDPKGHIWRVLNGRLLIVGHRMATDRAQKCGKRKRIIGFEVRGILGLPEAEGAGAI
jgi:transcriptional regulator with XRE-family HTH domain